MKKYFCLLFVFSLVAQNELVPKNDCIFFNLRRAQRRINAHLIKSAVAEFDECQPICCQGTNGDEQLFADKRGNYNKALQHQTDGFPDVAAYNSLVFALQCGLPQTFDTIQLGLGRRLVNPQASLAFSLEGNDAWINCIPPAPPFASAETAAEMVEDYWTVLLRDVPFNEFATDGDAALAIADLNTLTDFTGPKINGLVTGQTLLRGVFSGDLVGPFISQFLYQTIPYGTTTIGPEQTVPLPGIMNNFMTNFADWFTVINGGATGDTIMLDPMQHFLRTPRDLSEYVYKDTPGQEAINACLILLFGSGFGSAAFDKNNPYLTNPTQEGFVTYDLADFLALIRSAAQEALKAAWYQKWQVHRRLRPEEFGFYVQQTIVNGMSLGINEQLINSPVLPMIFGLYGSYFLPQAYPEGSPAHPAYPAGHAAMIGAGVTMLKALFDENFIIPNPLEPDMTNTMLDPYMGTPLTVGGELNKLASNIALGRDFAGVHYRSDGTNGILLGEAIAINILENEAFLRNENFCGWSLTKFDGTTITVGAKRCVERNP